MNGIDYTKQLNKEKANFKDSIEKTNKSAEKRIADSNDRNEMVQTKQRENFVQDRAELESGYQKNLEVLKDKTKNTLDNSGSNFHDKIAKERENFVKDSAAKTKDFDQRLNDIKSSYTKATKEQVEGHEMAEANQKKRYTKNVDTLVKDKDQQLGKFQERMVGSGANLKDQFNRERQQLVRSHEENVSGVYKTEAQKRQAQTDRLTQNMMKTKEATEADNEHQKQYTEDKVSNIQKKSSDNNLAMTMDYANKNEELVDAQQRSSVKTNKEHAQKVVEMERGFNKSLRNIENERRRRDNGSGEYSEVANKQQGLNDQINSDSKIRNLKSQLDNEKGNYQLRASDEQDKFNQTLKTENADASAHLQRKTNELNANKIVTVAGEREKSKVLVENREHQNKLESQKYEQQIMVERNQASSRMANLKDSFHRSMKSLEEKSMINMEDLNKVNMEDKTTFVKNLNESRNKEIFELKREFVKEMDGMVLGYEQRLNEYSRENESLKLNMNMKIGNILDQTEKQLKSQRVLFEDRRAAETKDAQLAMDQREHKLKSDMNSIVVNFTKKLDKMQVDHDAKLKLITNEYENKLKELNAVKSREIASKDMTQQTETQRIKQAFEEEKSRLVGTYENTIASLRATQNEKMEQLKEFKKLS